MKLNLDGYASVADLRETGRVLLNLGDYAQSKANAMEIRAKGHIEMALRIEQRLEVIYNRLPEWARW